DNIHEIVICGIPFGEKSEKDALKKIKDIGATSVQIYTFWREIEPFSRGTFNWDLYDRQIELIDKAGLKYVPFILMGPKYASPTWWLESKKHKGLYCIEHDRYSPIESIWNPFFKEEITRVLTAFSEHYLPMNVIESIQPGICGDYGEAIFPVHGNWPGDYHTHKGYWCGDDNAKQSFRDWLLKKYNSINELNRAWRANYTAFGEIVPSLPHKAPSRTAYFDTLQWYRQAMTEYAEFWLRECRRIFPEIPVYLCTGGMEEPEHGSSFSSQAKVAAKHDCGIRLTNEGNKFYENFFWTAYTKSACDFYGSYLGLEPVGPMTDNGVIIRVFGTAAYGNKQIFHYYDNLFDKENNYRPAAVAVNKYLSLIKQSKPNESVAFFWPGYYVAWNGGMPDDVYKALTFVRKMRNCMPVNEEMILDGVLSRYKLLIIPISCFTSREVLIEIASWVKSGGIVFVAGTVTDLELNNVNEYNEIYGINSDSEEASGHCKQIIEYDKNYIKFNSIKQYHTSKSWFNLNDNVVLLSSTKEERGYSDTTIKKTSSAFYKKSGKGLAIYYCGPVSFEDDSEALFYDPGVFKALLHDILVNFSETKDLGPLNDEIARAEIDGSIYALKEGEIVKL
ncbi:MAG TPA: beta-galactosidase, partial [Clostridia bacterium]|nr:beta-galactosidase [Clostridia bacterium]